MTIRVLAIAVLVALAFPASAELAKRQGLIDEVKLIDIASLEGDSLLIMTLEDGGGFLIPGRRNLAAGPGMQVAVDYLPGDEDGDLPMACRIRVLAVPLTVEGEEILQPASRPFKVYRNPDGRCELDENSP